MSFVAPRGYRRSRRKQWWKSFTTPRLMLIGGPILVVPLATLLILQTGPAPLTPVELAVAELPTSGAANAFGTDGTAPFGPQGQRLSVTHAMPLQAGSARFETARLTMRESERAVHGADVDFLVSGFAQLHPVQRAYDNFLIGDIALAASNPADANIGARLFAEYCAASPNDTFYNFNVRDLPISESSLQVALSWSSLPGTSGHCPVNPG